MPSGPLVPLIKTAHAETLVGLLKQFETDIYPLLRAAGLPEDLLNASHEYLPETPVKHLLALMAERAEPRYFGELLRTTLRERVLPPLMRQLDNPATLGDAINQLSTVLRHESPTVQVDLQYFNRVPWLCRYKAGEHSEGYRWAEIFSVLFLIEFVGLASKSEWQPSGIAIQSDSGDVLAAILEAQRPANVAQARIFANRRVAAVELSEALLSQPFHLPARFSDTSPLGAPVEHQYLETVYLALTPYLSRQALSLSEAATLLDTSPRTLQRKLAEAGSSFNQVRENIVLATACRLMEDPRYSLTDIASTLGYADIAHFSRAFKRLTGFPPRDYRKRYLSAPVPE